MPRPGIFVRFFSTATEHNKRALTKRPLQFFIDTVPSPQLMIERLKEQRHFLRQTFPHAPKKLEYYLEKDGFDLKRLAQTPRELLCNPMTLSFSGKTFADLQEPYKSLAPLLETYVTTIMLVFGDQLAKRPYDPKEKLNENTSELVHAIQSLIITWQLRAREKNKFAVLALQHDIARATIANAHHGDAYHHTEADQILAPQGYSQDMATRYPFLHPFAKYMWSFFSKEYRDELLSPVSAYSLVGQQKESTAIMKQLNELYFSLDPQKQEQKSEQLLTLISRMMLLRLVDDSAKVAMPKCERLLTQSQIKQLLTEQMVAYIQTLSGEHLPHYQESLKEALILLRRTKMHSIYPESYQHCLDEDALLSLPRGYHP